jgi:hypothetical protein
MLFQVLWQRASEQFILWGAVSAYNHITNNDFHKEKGGQRSFCSSLFHGNEAFAQWRTDWFQPALNLSPEQPQKLCFKPLSPVFSAFHLPHPAYSG